MIISRVLFCFLIFYDSLLLFSIEWGGYTVNPFHQQDKQWFEDRRRRINDRIYGTEVKDRFLFSFLSTKIRGQPPWRWLGATQQAGNGCLHAETEHSHLCAPNRIELIQELNGGAWPQWLFD